jgi:hypothetical protein
MYIWRRTPVPAAVGHGIRGAANSRQRWSVGPGFCRVGCGGRIPSAVATAARPWRRGPRRQRRAYIRGRAPTTGPSLTPSNLRLLTLRSTSD